MTFKSAMRDAEAIALHQLNDELSDDDENDDDFEVSTALLSPHSPRTRAFDHPPPRSTWIQVKGLVTEVLPISPPSGSD
jgi:hypothetical protein